MSVLAALRVYRDTPNSNWLGKNKTQTLTVFGFTR